MEIMIEQSELCLSVVIILQLKGTSDSNMEHHEVSWPAACRYLRSIVVYKPLLVRIVKGFSYWVKVSNPKPKTPKLCYPDVDRCVYFLLASSLLTSSPRRRTHQYLSGAIDLSALWQKFCTTSRTWCACKKSTTWTR